MKVGRRQTAGVRRWLETVAGRWQAAGASRSALLMKMEAEAVRW